MSTISNQKKIKSLRKEYVMWTCFEFWPMKNSFWKLQEFDYSCLKIDRELLLHATFLRVHSNSKEVSYLSWPNTYPNLKTTCHFKLTFFLWTKLLDNLLLAKHLISAAASLISTIIHPGYLIFNDAKRIWILYYRG